MNTSRLSLAAVLSLAACGSSPDGAADASTDQQPVTDVRELADVAPDASADQQPVTDVRELADVATDGAADASADQLAVTDVRELADVATDGAADASADQLAVTDVRELVCARGFELDRCGGGAGACCVVDQRTTIPLGCGCRDTTGTCVRGACR